MGYTTVLKLLQIMHDKSLVQRDESSRAHVYGARVERDNTQRGLVEDLLHKGFGGSSHDLVLRALESRPVSREELQSLRELLDRLEVEDGE